MQRVCICALKKDRKGILEKIQSLGIMEMNQVAGDEEGFAKMDTVNARQSSFSVSLMVLMVSSTIPSPPLSQLLKLSCKMKMYTEARYEPDCYIMFGKESAGIPEEILVNHKSECFPVTYQRSEKTHPAPAGQYI